MPDDLRATGAKGRPNWRILLQGMAVIGFLLLLLSVVTILRQADDGASGTGGDDPAGLWRPAAEPSR